MAKWNCPACGSMADGRFCRCRACEERASSQKNLVLTGFLVASILVLISLWRLSDTRETDQNLKVLITSHGFILAPGGRGTDTSAMIENTNRIPVNVTVRVRGFDLAGKLVVEQRSGPFLNLAPGERINFAAHLAATPLGSVTFEAMNVEPVLP